MGAKTGARYESYWELNYAHDHNLTLIPIQLCKDWPQQPEDHDGGDSGEAHPLPKSCLLGATSSNVQESVLTKFDSTKPARPGLQTLPPSLANSRIYAPGYIALATLKVPHLPGGMWWLRWLVGSQTLQAPHGTTCTDHLWLNDRVPFGAMPLVTPSKVSQGQNLRIIILILALLDLSVSLVRFSQTSRSKPFWRKSTWSPFPRTFRSEGWKPERRNLHDHLWDCNVTPRYNHSIHLPIFSKSRADSHVIHDMTGNGDDGCQLFLPKGGHEVTVKGCNQRLLPIFTGNTSEIKNMVKNQSKTSCRRPYKISKSCLSCSLRKISQIQNVHNFAPLWCTPALRKWPPHASAFPR